MVMMQIYEILFTFASKSKVKLFIHSLFRKIKAMSYIRHLLRCYPVSSFYIAIIWCLCFMDVPETPLGEVQFIDKWTHVAMYAGTCLTIWIEYLRRHPSRPANTMKIYDSEDERRRRTQRVKLFALAWAAPVAMGGAIEILQATCTGGRRSGEWMDFAANSIGVTLAAIVGMALARFWKRRG